MNPKILAMGDMLVEIMRDRAGVRLSEPGLFLGPYPSGAPVIFAGAAARLGLDTSFVGSVGEDDFGEAILNRLDEWGVRTEKVKSFADETTGVAFVTYFEDGNRQFIFHVSKAAAGRIEEERLEPEYLNKFDHLHVMGTSLSINRKWSKATLKAARKIKENGGKISFDPNLRPEMLRLESLREACQSVLDLTDIFLPGGKELGLFVEDEGAGRGYVEIARELLETREMETVVIKRGPEGSTVVTDDDEFDVPSFPVEEVDPTGAGDCFDAGFLKGYYGDRSLEEAARLANGVGALAVTEQGPMEGIRDLEFVEDFMRKN